MQVLGQAFYIDAGAIREAIRLRRSFNVIHLETMFKVDVFVRKRRPYDQAQFERRLLQTLTTDPERVAYVASAGLGVIMGLIEEVRSRGGDIRLADLNETVMNIFEVLGFNHLCQVFDSEQNAVQSYRIDPK